jgi:hypothetical protein
MHSRCDRPSHPKFRLYGGRGIRVCARWSGRGGFENFLADMGERPAGMSLDRIDGDGNYEPSNCRWATDAEQNSNKATNHLVTHAGRTLTVAEWARRTGLLKTTIRNRLKAGWPVEAALTAPARRKAPNGAGGPRKGGMFIHLVVREDPKPPEAAP